MFGNNPFNAVSSTFLNSESVSIKCSNLRTIASSDLFNVFNRTNIKDLNTLYGQTDLSLTPSSVLGFNTPRDAFKSVPTV